MRVKIQARNSAGLLQDIIGESHAQAKHMMALEFTPKDLEYLKKRTFKQLGPARLHFGAVPVRVKIRVSGFDGKPLDIVADRTAGDWIALEVNAEELAQLTKTGPSKSARLVFYVGPRATDKTPPDFVTEIERFKSVWPEFSNESDDNAPNAQGIMPSLVGKAELAEMFVKWALSWPVEFHATEHAPKPRIERPDGTKYDIN